MAANFRAAAEALGAAQRIVVFTGAGVSAESGIATFRDAMTGLWSRFSPEDLATPEAFLRDPALVWSWYESRRIQLMSRQPNAGHLALAAMERSQPSVRIVTQNVDDLHERAGSSNVLHLHGSLFAARCFDCAAPMGGNPQAESAESDARASPQAPTCWRCGGHVRPGVVWFGETLPQEVVEASFELARAADAVLVVGTSGVVFPAADLPRQARHSGATVIQVNPHPSELDAVCHINLRGTSGDVLPRLCGLASSNRP